MPTPSMTSTFQSLGNWFERQKRVLPWRDQTSVYRVWVSEIMLQQTQVITVVPYFERFVKRFPTVESLAQSNEAEVTSQWAGLGYYSRARNLRKGAQLIVERGGFPTTREGWLEIPGVGEYTAGAVLSIALNQVEAILDGNVERVISRVKCVDRDKGDSVYKETLWKLSREWVTSASQAGVPPSVFNQAMMELGATLCTPKKPACLLCPLQARCEARKMGEPELYPPRKKPKEWIFHEETLFCCIDSLGRVLLRQRKPGEWRAGLWDLVEEKPRGLVAKKITEIETQHVVTRHKILRTTEIFLASRALELPQALVDANWKWVKLAQIPALGAGSALVKTLEKIKEQMPEAFLGASKQN